MWFLVIEYLFSLGLRSVRFASKWPEPHDDCLVERRDHNELIERRQARQLGPDTGRQWA